MNLNLIFYISLFNYSWVLDIVDFLNQMLKST